MPNAATSPQGRGSMRHAGSAKLSSDSAVESDNLAWDAHASTLAVNTDKASKQGLANRPREHGGLIEVGITNNSVACQLS